MSSLAETQRLLWQLITAPEGVAPALESLPGGRARLESVVAGDARLEATTRLDVYANMYFFRIRDVLRSDYPAVAAVLGDDAFHNLVTDYLLKHPSENPSLRFAGAALPAFLDEHAAATKQPDLADLARLEWAIVEAFDAADAPVLRAETLAAIPPEAWATIRFRFAPAFRIVESEHRVVELRALGAAADSAFVRPSVAAGGEVIRVWRRGFDVRFKAIPPEEGAALRAATGGASFGELCQRLAERRDESAAAVRAVELLRAWVADELLAGVT